MVYLLCVLQFILYMLPYCYAVTCECYMVYLLCVLQFIPYMLPYCYIQLLINVQVDTTQSRNRQMICEANFSADVSFTVY